MMTTSLKLSDELKQRAAMVAQHYDMSAHAFMVQSIEQATEAAERRCRFIADAEVALTETRASGEGYPADAVHAHLRRRIAGKKTTPLEAVSWRD